MAEEKKIQKMVRILSTDVDGNLSVIRALRRIKGISFMYSNAICIKTGVDPHQKIGFLDSSEIKNLEVAVKSELPNWIVNRRKDPESGANKHLIGTEIMLQLREDINLMRKLRTYKGIRHELGQPVRGQRTRSTFRKNKTVGVSRKKAMAAKKGAAAAPATPPKPAKK
jgi:small subunit ribosomal protein S13